MSIVKGHLCVYCVLFDTIYLDTPCYLPKPVFSSVYSYVYYDLYSSPPKPIDVA